MQVKYKNKRRDIIHNLNFFLQIHFWNSIAVILASEVANAQHNNTKQDMPFTHTTNLFVFLP